MSSVACPTAMDKAHVWTIQPSQLQQVWVDAADTQVHEVPFETTNIPHLGCLLYTVGTLLQATKIDRLSAELRVPA